MIGHETHGSDEYVLSLLIQFRFLEAAGACELLACFSQPQTRSESCWWSALAAIARGYSVAMFDAGCRGYPVIAGWADTCDASYFREETSRLALEYEYWLNVVPGGGAYVAWVGAYVAAAELDGRRALDALRACTSIAANFLDVSTVALAPSVYEQLQLAADALPRFLPLPQHPLTDMRRFVLLPTTFRR